MDLDALYQQMILEHNKKPRNFKSVEGATHYSHGLNPLCGDDYYVYIRLKDEAIEDIGFQGSGCAISKSSASLMTHSVKGKTKQEALSMKDDFLNMITTDCDCETKERLGNLKIFEGVKKFPIRVKCATLIWRAFEDALDSSDQKKEVSTE